MQACSLPPADRRRQIQRVGKDLMQHYGRKKYYTVNEVQQANLRQCISLDFWCWSHAMFNSHYDFDALHRSLGETCDYVSMKSTMLEAVSSAVETTSWFNFDFDLPWIDFPDFDWSIFDVFDIDL